MLIEYDKDIRYDPDRSNHAERQQLVSNIAKFLSAETGEIALIKPENVHVTYNIQPGEVKIKSKVGSVDNTFSALEKQITDPIQEAICLKVKIELLEKLATLSDEAIITRIRTNHGDATIVSIPFKCAKNLTSDAVDNTLRQIQHLGVTGLKLFSGGGADKTPTQLSVSHALKEVGVENIKSLEQVNIVMSIVDSKVQLPKAAPSGRR